MRRRGYLVSCLVVAALGAAAEPALAGHAGPGHWSRDGLGTAQAYFVDHTGTQWPVSTSVYKWNEATRPRSYYVTSCPSSSLHCIHVRGYTNGTAPSPSCVGAYGCTFVPVGAGNHFGNVRVYLNNTTVNTAYQHRKTTCHELGHALGLGHRSTNDSCMRQGESPPISRFPDSHDFGGLANLYDHAN
jgi:hypothetical protein